MNQTTHDGTAQRNIYLLCSVAPLSLIIGVAALLYPERNEFAVLGKLIVLGVCPIVLAAIVVGHLSSPRSIVERESIRFRQSKLIHPLLLQLLLFLSIFLADWVYPLILKEFGLKKYIYPSLLSIVAIPLAVLSNADGGDASEIAVFVLLPTFLVIHCVSWFHVNLVCHRVSNSASKAQSQGV